MSDEMVTLSRYALTEDGEGFVIARQWQVPASNLTYSGFSRTMEDVLTELQVMKERENE